MAREGRQRRRMWWRLLIAITVTAAWMLFSSSDIGDQYEFLIHDQLVRARGTGTPPQNVVVVALDEATYRAWDLPMDRPIPRQRYAQLVRKLAELGATRAVFDVVFAGPGPNPDWDEEFAASIEGLPVVLGIDYGVHESNGAIVHDVVMPYERFLRAGATGGVVAFTVTEGIIRHFFLKRDEVLAELPFLADAAVQEAHELPTAADLVRFYGPAGTVTTYSMYQVMEPTFPANLLRGATVFIGLNLRTGLGATQKDNFRTPMGDIFGVEIHATQTANIMHHEWIHRPSREYERIVGGCVIFLAAFLVTLLRPFASALCTLGCALGWIMLSHWMLSINFFLTGGSGVLAAVPLAFLGNTTYSYLRTRHKKQEIERAFSHYLSPEMVEQLKQNPRLLSLGGKEVVATAMFTDIVGFTAISEKLGAVGVSQMLNAYFSEVSRVILQEGGTVIKFIGDAVFAVWGAPIPSDDHAERAYKAAVRLQRVIAEFNKKGEHPPLETRIGVSTGPMVVGNLGSDQRFDYTAIGDAVNLASRIEGANRYLGTRILITEESLDAGHLSHDALRIGAIQVVGRSEAVSVYTPAGAVSAELRSAWEAAIALFQERRWDEAAAKFSEVAAQDEQLRVASGVYLDEIRRFQGEEPPDEWRGELVLGGK